MTVREQQHHSRFPSVHTTREADIAAEVSAPKRWSAHWPAFRALRGLRNGHLQTLAGAFWLANKPLLVGTTQHELTLPDGDLLVLHDDRGPLWQPGDRCALLVHGLAGCHRSGYMLRIARKLMNVGVRVFRLDLRGCGAGRNLASHPYHAGRWGDLQAVGERIIDICPGSALGVAGFSLGGNLVLRWLGEAVDWTTAHFDRAMAINPPIDLAASTENIARAAGGLYDRHFSRLLYRQVQGTRQWRPESPLAQAGRCPDRLIQFDELFTAPLSGYGSAAEYYQQASAAPILDRIETPTLILSAADDPLIPPEMFAPASQTRKVQLHLEPHGGHLGYIAAAGADPDRHWMDWRVVDWLTSPIQSGQ